MRVNSATLPFTSPRRPAEIMFEYRTTLYVGLSFEKVLLRLQNAVHIYTLFIIRGCLDTLSHVVCVFTRKSNLRCLRFALVPLLHAQGYDLTLKKMTKIPDRPQHIGISDPVNYYDILCRTVYDHPPSTRSSSSACNTAA